MIHLLIQKWKVPSHSLKKCTVKASRWTPAVHFMLEFARTVVCGLSGSALRRAWRGLRTFCASVAPFRVFQSADGFFLSQRSHWSPDKHLIPPEFWKYMEHWGPVGCGFVTWSKQSSSRGYCYVRSEISRRRVMFTWLSLEVFGDKIGLLHVRTRT